MPVGYPQFYWEGTPEDADALGRNISKTVTGELTPRPALDEAAEEWVKIVRSWASTSRRSRTHLSSMAHGSSATRSDAGSCGGRTILPRRLSDLREGFHDGRPAETGLRTWLNAMS